MIVNPDATHEALRGALSRLAERGPLREGAVRLFAALGYESERTMDVGSVDTFVALLEETKPLTDKQRGLFVSWRSADIVFQVTKNEIRHQEGRQASMFDSFDRETVKSFLFVAADLEDCRYSRTELAETTRAVNRGFRMPVVVLFRYGATLTLAAVHRRAHKQDTTHDVLEKVTLIKDIRTVAPHRAHLEILGELALSRLMGEGVRGFDELLTAWERVLDIEELNKRFYRDLFRWFEWAVKECRFPDDGAGEGSTERHVIRLITRLLFIWFLNEKGLVPDELFDESFAHKKLKNHAPDRTDYYRAVLQNLFFATLNTEIDKRAFSKKSHAAHRDFSKYRYRDLLADPNGFVGMLKAVPFVNGGLFDCLDDFSSVGEGGHRIDAFTDNIDTQGRDLNVPACAFFDEEYGLFPLFRHYKFTVEENTPIDREVALDPELLGRIFENLLAAYNPETRETARKGTGSYYTPRQIVDHMVHEVLTEALTAKNEPADGDEAFWRERLFYLLDHSDAMDDADALFEEGDRRTIVAAIADIKTLDPAAGSGAFPMAILQVLTLELRRLDPDNALWEAFQKERAKAQAGEAFDAKDQQQRDDALREISDTFEKYRQSDFGRKLYIVQHSIYGVDIQPIACQIAKPRFFISLVIEQDPDPDESNLGIKPLPNLETRFVAADTLIGLQAETGSLLLDDTVLSKRKAVAAVRERYFLADSRKKKRECITAEQRMRKELRDVLETERRNWATAQQREIERKADEFPTLAAREEFLEKAQWEFDRRQRDYDDALTDARKVAEWDPYDQNGGADWFDAEYMFGVSGGFDVVIGNPPYIQLQKDSGRARKQYQEEGYETFASTGDIYQLFYERGCGLLTPGAGALAYITSNSWLKAEYGKRLRRWFAERHTPLRLIEMGKDIFDAIVDTAILLVREGGHAARLPAVDTDRCDSEVFPPPESRWGEARLDEEAPWSILSAIEWRVLDKMRAVGVPLKDWDVRINRGVLTGYNEAFIIDDATRNALVAEDRRSDEIIKPVLRGRDIRRWRARWAGKWLIDTHNGYGDKPDRVPPIDVGNYPAVKRHLDKFFPSLRRRQDQGQTPYNLRNCAYHEDFSKEKLFWMHMAPTGRFAYANEDMVCNQKAFMLIGDSLKYLCAILNSKTIMWRIKNTAVTTGMGLTQWDKFTVERLPIPKISDAQQQLFIQLVDDIIASKVADPDADTTAQEEEIDRLVYTLYGLTRTEVAAVGKGPQ